jgi:uncharacterized protein (TIGR02391 family)
MPGLMDYLPTADNLLALGPEDLGIILLEIIQKARVQRITLTNLEMPLWNANTPAYPIQAQQQVALAIAEAWQWLQNEGLLITDPEQSAGYFCLTRKGKRLTTTADIEAYRQGKLLPTEALHPIIAEKVRPMFLRGDYDVAVVQAFKEVEVAVRSAARLSAALVGVDLMRTAFNPASGPLTDTSVIMPEREALAHLFAGAIGYAKNPGSHRAVRIERIEAAQLIAFASLLASIAEARAPAQ